MNRNLIPYTAWTDFTPTLPEFYWDIYSSEQRIKHICFELCKIHHYADYLADRINELGEEVEDEINAIREELAKNEANFKAEILRILEEMTIGTLQWDVQHGFFTTSVDAQRDMFNDVTVHSYNNRQLETIYDDLDMTVDDLANCGLNVKGYALMNHLLLKPETITDDLIPSNPTGRGKYTVADLSNSQLDLDGYIYVEGA